MTSVSPLAPHWDSIRAGLGVMAWFGWYTDTGAVGQLAFIPDPQRVAPGDSKIEMTNAKMRASMDAMRKSGSREFVVPPAYDVKVISADPKAASLHETLRESIQAICRVYNIPPISVGELSRSTYSIYGSAKLAELATVHYWTGVLEREMSNILWRDGSRRVVFDRDRLSGERIRDRMGSLRDAVFAGIMTAAEARALLHLPPTDDPEAHKLIRNPVVDDELVDANEDVGNFPVAEGDDEE